MAPEVLYKEYDEKCDSWSCGVILYTMLSGGTPPFDDDDDLEVMRLAREGDVLMKGKMWDYHISDLAKSLVKGLLCFDPAKRLTMKQALDHEWFNIETPAILPA